MGNLNSPFPLLLWFFLCFLFPICYFFLSFCFFRLDVLKQEGQSNQVVYSKSVNMNNKLKHSLTPSSPGFLFLTFLSFSVFIFLGLNSELKNVRLCYSSKKQSCWLGLLNRC